MAPSTLTRPDATHPLAQGTRLPVERSRLAAYAIFGASVGALPLPWLPDALLRRIRGAVVHDLAARHGLSLTPEARAVLAEPSSAGEPRALGSQVLGYVGVRIAVRVLARFGPVAAVWPIRDALRTYVLGHLFHRYLDGARSEQGFGVDAEEARRVRRAVDGALARALTVDVSGPEKSMAMDDQRDATTAFIDGLLDHAAGIPARLLGRLEAAFDDLLSRTHG